MDRDSSLGMALPLEIHAFPLIFPSFLCSLCGISGISARFIRVEILFANLETQKFKSRLGLIFSMKSELIISFSSKDRSKKIHLEKVIKYFSKINVFFVSSILHRLSFFCITNNAGSAHFYK